MFTIIKNVIDECPLCEHERELQYGKLREKLDVRNEEVIVESNAYYCPTGKHYFADLADEDEKFEKAYNEYRKRKGLLQPKEIKQIRDKYGLSQRDFARLLGFGEITIQRYESGAIQDDAHNNLIFSIKETEGFRKLFEQRKNHLPPIIVGRIERKLIVIENEERQLILNYIFKEDSPQPATTSPLLHATWRHGEYKEVVGDYLSQNKEGALALAA